MSAAPFNALLFDGLRSAGTPVEVRAGARGCVRIVGEGVSVSYRLDELEISSRLGNTTRYLKLPDGGKLETPDNAAVDRLLADGDAGRHHGLLHALESSWGRAALALAIAIVFSVWGILVALPWLAERVARTIPIEIEHTMGRQSLAALDAHLLEPTRATEAERVRVRRAFSRVVADLDLPLEPRLELRRAPGLGPNAFALPSGIVVVTDDMTELAGGDEQLMAVIAHELGHVHHRHVMRSVLQSSVVALALAVVLGDVSSITGLAATIPTVLVEQGFSRTFELEADRFAVAWMDRAGLERAHLAEVLRKLAGEHDAAASPLGDYLSTHPRVERRIEAILTPPPGE